FIFPEIDYDKVKEVIGMDISLVTTAETDEEGLDLLRRFGLPFKIKKGA
ncbi:MAG: 50S ribosomal protein L5, partial [candidate division WOR-3 bacterium]